MKSPAILGTSGRPIVEYGGDSAWLVRTKGDVVCSFQWLDVNDESGEDQAAMCFYPVVKKADGGAFAILQNCAHLYATRKGHATPHTMGAAFKYCMATGAHPDKATIFRVMDIILESLPDLQKMPSSKPIGWTRAQPIQGIEIAVKVDGKTFHEALI
jgi:hypothetical protein